MLLKPVMCMSAASAEYPSDAYIYTSYIIYKEQRYVGRPFPTACVPLLFLSKKFFIQCRIASYVRH